MREEVVTVRIMERKKQGGMGEKEGERGASLDEQTRERGKNEEDKREWGRRGRRSSPLPCVRMCAQGREEKSERRGRAGALLLVMESPSRERERERERQRQREIARESERERVVTGERESDQKRKKRKREEEKEERRKNGAP